MREECTIHIKLSFSQHNLFRYQIYTFQSMSHVESELLEVGDQETPTRALSKALSKTTFRSKSYSDKTGNIDISWNIV